jgi:hypothetical protein
MAHINIPLRVPGVVSRLHVDPRRSPATHQLADAGSDRGRNWLAHCQHIIKMLPRNTEPGSDFRFGKINVIKNIRRGELCKRPLVFS